MAIRSNSLVTAIALAAGAGFSSQAQAAYSTVDITAQTNADIQTYTEGYLYPYGGTSLTFGGVPFVLATDQGAAGTTGVIQSRGVDTFTVPVGISGAESAYVLVNSAFGSLGTNTGSLIFTDSVGHTYTDTLIEGKNIRDHFDGVFVNTATDIYATHAWDQNGGGWQNNVRLDAYAIALPTAFWGNTLVSVTLNGTGAGGGGEPFLAGLTVSTTSVPEPSTWAMMLAGLAGLGFAGHRASRKAVARAA